MPSFCFRSILYAYTPGLLSSLVLSNKEMSHCMLRPMKYFCFTWLFYGYTACLLISRILFHKNMYHSQISLFCLWFAQTKKCLNLLYKFPCQLPLPLYMVFGFTVILVAPCLCYSNVLFMCSVLSFCMCYLYVHSSYCNCIILLLSGLHHADGAGELNRANN